MNRIGRLQRNIIRLLAESPRRVDVLHAALPAYRRDNVLRAVRHLKRQGFIVDDGGTLSCPEPPVLNDEKRAASIARHEYGALSSAFLLLSQGAPCTGDELFPPNAVSRQFAAKAIDALERARLIEQLTGCYSIADGRLFQSTWADERLFCATLGWECDTEQAYSIALLLGGGSLREEAAAAAVLYECIGQWNTSRRTGLPVGQITALRRVAALSPETQDAMVRRGLNARWILGFPAGTPEPEVVAAIESGPPEKPQAAAADSDSSGGEPPSELPDAELLAHCLKLCAFTAATVARMERKLDFLATELGYHERE